MLKGEYCKFIYYFANSKSYILQVCQHIVKRQKLPSKHKRFLSKILYMDLKSGKELL